MDETRRLLKPDEALVQFTVARAQTGEMFVWAINWDGERWARSELSVKALEHEVAALRCGLDYRSVVD